MLIFYTKAYSVCFKKMWWWQQQWWWEHWTVDSRMVANMCSLLPYWVLIPYFCTYCYLQTPYSLLNTYLALKWLLDISHLAGWYSSNTLDFCSEDTHFKSWLSYWISWLTLFLGFKMNNGYIHWNKKFWKELTAHLPFTTYWGYDMVGIEKVTFNSSCCMCIHCCGNIFTKLLPSIFHPFKSC
jgi:hypothetical protein